jgi:hypothetical protein
MAITVNTAFV